MGRTDHHPHLDFARRYADPTQQYLTAYVALTRLEVLLEDLQKIRRLLDAAEPKSDRWAPWFGAEIASYYAVGFVTCLEWHARARIVDLLTFRPSALRPEDLKGQANDKILTQMIVDNAPVTHLVAASLSVTSADKYIAVFGRILQELGFAVAIGDWLAGELAVSIACWVQPHQLANFKEVFEFRHMLVHEIGSGVIGHPNIRDSWSPDQALEMGRTVASIIAGLESAITQAAPSSFPNLLTDQLGPVSPLARFQAELERLESIADSEVRKAEFGDSGTTAAWETAMAAAHAHMEAEEAFIQRASMLHWRYFDARFPLRLNAIQYRIRFLKELLDNFTSVHLPDPQEEPPASMK